MEPLIEELRREEEGIMRADRALDKIARDREKWARWLFWDNQRLVRNSDMDAAREKGRMIGQEEGRKEGIALGEERGRKEGIALGEERSREEIARKALAEGLSIEFVQKITGLSGEEIEKLR